MGSRIGPSNHHDFQGRAVKLQRCICLDDGKNERAPNWWVSDMEREAPNFPFWRTLGLNYHKLHALTTEMFTVPPLLHNSTNDSVPMWWFKPIGKSVAEMKSLHQWEMQIESKMFEQSTSDTSYVYGFI